MQYLLLVKYLVIITLSEYALRALGVAALLAVGIVLWRKARP